MTQEEHIANLKKTVWHWSQRLSVVVGFVLGGFIFAEFVVGGVDMAWTESQTISAKRFVLEDQYGRARVILAMVNDKPMLSLHDSEGKPRVWLEAGDDGPKLCMTDISGPRVWLEVKDNGPKLSMANERGKVCVLLSMSNDGVASLSLIDADGKPFAHMAASSEMPPLSLGDKNGNTIWGGP